MPSRQPAYLRIRYRVPSAEAAPAPTADELLGAAAQHCLFMHQQIPCVYTELRRAVASSLLPSASSSRKRPRRGTLEQKAGKLLASLEPLLSHLAPALTAAAAASGRPQAAKPEAEAEAEEEEEEEEEGPDLIGFRGLTQLGYVQT